MTKKTRRGKTVFIPIHRIERWIRNGFAKRITRYIDQHGYDWSFSDYVITRAGEVYRTRGGNKPRGKARMLKGSMNQDGIEFIRLYCSETREQTTRSVAQLLAQTFTPMTRVPGALGMIRKDGEAENISLENLQQWQTWRPVRRAYAAQRELVSN